MRRLWPLTVRGTGALVLAVACFVVASEIGIVELMYFGILLLAVLAASVASLYLARRSDAVDRSLSPDVATVGREIARHRAGRRAHRGAHRSRHLARHDAEGPVGHARRASSRRSARDCAAASGCVGSSRTRSRGVRRGIHPIGPLQVRSTDPFGLARRTHRLRREAPR